MQNQRNLFIVLVLVVLSRPVFCQLVIDATAPGRQLSRKPTLGRGGGVGRKIPLRVAIRSTGSPPDQDGKTLVEFTLTNAGKDELILPISPNPADFEAPDPKARYTFMTLALRLSLSGKPAVTFSGGADLYGNDTFPESVLRLSPHDSVRVLTSVALPVLASNEVLIATVSVNKTTIMVSGEETLSDSQEIGFARSPEYRLRCLSSTEC